MSEKGGHGSTTQEKTQRLEKMRGNTNLQMTQLHKRESSKGGLKRNSWSCEYPKFPAQNQKLLRETEGQPKLSSFHS